MNIIKTFGLSVLAVIGVGTVQAEDVVVDYDMTKGLLFGEEKPSAFGITADNEAVAADDKKAVVVISGTSNRNDEHSIVNNPTVTFKTDRAFTLTLGGCFYENKSYTVTIDDEEVTTLSTKTDKCYHQDKSSVTWALKTAPEKEVTVKVTGGLYLPYLGLRLIDPIQEKELYSTNFTDWCEYEQVAVETVKEVELNTKYSHEKLTFSINNCQIGCTNFNTGKFPDWNGGFIMCAKSTTPYIMTSKLASITTVEFEHGATGSNRGYKLEAKGDGDADWVVISNSTASTQAGTVVKANVNRTNVQLRFTNLTTDQNAYLMYLIINGNVDMSKTPSLDKLTINGEQCTAADIFAEDEEGNMAARIEIPKSKEMISAENPLTNLVAGNGEIGEVTYRMTPGGAVATIPVTAGEITVNYKATFVFKPDFTLTYKNIDGEVIGTQTVEKDSKIEEFAYGATEVTVAEGSAFRGWFVATKGDNNRKYTTEDVVVGDITLYAVVTEIETQNTTSSYVYKLANQYFYAEDHEGFNPEGTGKYHSNHGWKFGNGDKVNVLVGGKAILVFELCLYSKANPIVITNSEGVEVGRIENDKASTDGASQAVEYDGPADVLTITFNGESYLHGLTVTNTAGAPIEKNAAGWYVVDAGNTGHLLSTLTVASAQAKGTERTYVFIPDGVYDLGETVLTSVSGKNLSLIGESMDNTIIVNAPDKAKEDISTTATLVNNGSDLYMQDLTLRNELDYYHAGPAGRAVCLQDKGSKTICKNVRMESYQDTYYSNRDNKFYWETSEIHGTVDFICGDGDVIFNQCDIVVEPKNADGSGESTIAAPYTSDGCKWGYLLLDCNIISKAAAFNLGRAWGGVPRLQYINTTLVGDAKDGIVSNRFAKAGINVVPDRFVEYGTKDDNGATLTPASNKVTFTAGKSTKELETVMAADEAAKYTIANIFGEWEPDKLAAQLEAPEVTVADGVATWTNANKATAYAVYVNDKFKEIVSGTRTSYTLEKAGDRVAVRAANSMGGFGVLKSSGVVTSIDSVEAESDVVAVEIYNIQGQKVGRPTRGLNVVVSVMSDGSTRSEKVLVK